MYIENNISKQKGATLIVALILLALMTIIGLSSMDSSTIDVKIVANSKDRQLAFNGAESGLFQGGKLVSNTECPLDPTTTPAYAEDTFAADRDFWRDSNNWTLSAVAGTDIDAEFMIETFQEGPTGPMSEQSINAPRFYYYPVLAKATGPGNANVILQSHFVTKHDGDNCLNP